MLRLSASSAARYAPKRKAPSSRSVKHLVQWRVLQLALVYTAGISVFFFATTHGFYKMEIALINEKHASLIHADLTRTIDDFALVNTQVFQQAKILQIAQENDAGHKDVSIPGIVSSSISQVLLSARTLVPDLGTFYFDEEQSPVSEWEPLLLSVHNRSSARFKEFADLVQDVEASNQPISTITCPSACYLNYATTVHPYSISYGFAVYSTPLDRVFTSLRNDLGIDLHVLQQSAHTIDDAFSFAYQRERVFPIYDDGLIKSLLSEGDFDVETNATAQINDNIYSAYRMTIDKDAGFAEPVSMLVIDEVSDRQKFILDIVKQFLLVAALGMIMILIGIIYLTKNPIRNLTRISQSLKGMGDGAYDEAENTLSTAGMAGYGHELEQLHTMTLRLNQKLEILESKTKEQNRKLLDFSLTDSLTGILNRRALIQVLKKLVKKEKPFALLIVDLDYFKLVNDTFGHAAGDQYLIMFSQMLRRSVGEDNSFGRTGGDEFFVIIHQSKEGSVRQEAERVAEQIIQNSKEIPIHSGLSIEREFKSGTTVSIGIALFPEQTSSVGELQKIADIAMYENKQTRKGSYRVYTGDEKLLHRRVKTKSWNDAITRALQENNLVAYYQPIVSAADQKLFAYESLARLIDDTGEVVPTSEFIDYITHTQTIIDVDLAMIRRVFSEIADQQLTEKVFINVSSLTGSITPLHDFLLEQMKRHNISGEQLVIEITEQSAIQDKEGVIDLMNALNEHGVCWALDDFGDGFSSIGLLTSLPLHYLKLDKHVVSSIGLVDIENRIDQSKEVARNIFSLCRRFGIKSIAEGVETALQWQTLKELKVDFIQGIFVADPNPGFIQPKKLPPTSQRKQSK